jgi:hypothetical protein
MRSNITLMKWMIANGYRCRTLGRRIKAMEAWIAKPELLRADADAEYAAVIEIDLADVKEPLVAARTIRTTSSCCPQWPATKIDEVFIGSCMTNIGHFRAAGKVLEGKTDIPTRLWIAPPTKMDAMILNEEGYYASSASPARAWKCPAARCAWATRHRSQGQHGDVDLDAQLPQPARHRHLRVSRLGRTGRGLRADGPDPDRGRVSGAGAGGQCQGGRRLSLHELRPDRIR